MRAGQEKTRKCPTQVPLWTDFRQIFVQHWGHDVHRIEARTILLWCGTGNVRLRSWSIGGAVPSSGESSGGEQATGIRTVPFTGCGEEHRADRDVFYQHHGGATPRMDSTSRGSPTGEAGMFCTSTARLGSKLPTGKFELDMKGLA